MPISVAICFSPDWLGYVAVEVHAIQSFHPDAQIYLISDAPVAGQPAGTVWIDAEQVFHDKISSLNVTSRFTKYTLYRLLIPEIIPDAKLLYLDADTLVNGSLDELWNIDLHGALLAGAEDIGILPHQVEAAGLEPGEPYINSGVMLMDLDRIRAEGLPDIWLHEINTTHYSCHDQDVINKTCRGRIRLVSNRWNSSASTGHTFPPGIAHFAGPAAMKPWVNRSVVNYDVWSRWEKHYADSQADSLLLVRGSDAASEDSALPG